MKICTLTDDHIITADDHPKVPVLVQMKFTTLLIEIGFRLALVVCSKYTVVLQGTYAKCASAVQGLTVHE